MTHPINVLVWGENRLLAEMLSTTEPGLAIKVIAEREGDVYELVGRHEIDALVYDVGSASAIPCSRLLFGHPHLVIFEVQDSGRRIVSKNLVPQETSIGQVTPAVLLEELQSFVVSQRAFSRRSESEVRSA